ncbi:hypothetical protein C2845_PM14G20300 [Panicum miliaceum]|uniref:Kinesin motor domain-containing protein n=1 Tax=Panicum miliaceum TaxID=4540 RepID=A0A3L6PUH7_PANMI|nr:hypothetical protein C2845_PM14G20300 [Panicum miliaceum]
MGAAGEEMAAEAKEERILVSVRLRPLNGREAGDSSDWECISPTTIMFRSTVPERAMFPTAYTYDRVFGPSCSTRQVYEEGAKEVALSVVSGINSSIFAYGQTSSGKTYTMTGITEYSMLDIYDYIDKHPEREFILKFSAIEIYNEAVRDLLSHDSTPLRLLDDPEKGTTVERLTEETLRDYNHLRDLLTTIESSTRQYLGRGNSSTLVACVNFVDLAGSERASQTASAGMRLKEGSHINRSLLTLGKVVRQLSKGRNGHIPYRDSKLTRILQSSLGGNARTAIICTMSPAHTHIEQSRNTLLFATCAKEVITNAHVNVVMSDKALVKHLQRELARLENELKFPGSASCTTHTEALREKDAQIKKLEKQLKELMEERDTVQSQLNCLLKGDGDDHGYEHTAKRWDEHSRSSESLAQNVSEEALSVADAYGVAQQDQDYASFNGSYVCSSDHNDSAFLGETRELPRQTWEQKLVSPWHPPSNHSSDGIEPYHMKEAASTTASEVSEDHCREVQCIEIHEHVRSRSQEFSQLLPEDTMIQTPDVEVISKDALPQSDEQQGLESIKGKIEDHVKSYPINYEQQAENRTNIEEDSVKMNRCESERIKENAVKLYTCDSNHSFNIGKPYPHECLSLKRCIMSSKDRALARSNSCRASFMVIPNSWFDDSDNTSRTPPDEIFRYAPRRLDKQAIRDDSTTMRTVKDVGVDIALSPIHSPSHPTVDFEKKQQQIIELWHECNVSIVHRTYFFLLFRGDPADNIYMEVEHRRLSFIKSSFTAEPLAQGELNPAITSSLKNLRRERDMLYRQMLKKLSNGEKESIYSKWGIDLSTKQRRLQLSRLIWTRTDMEHIRESASLVARLIDLLEPGQALKEMFGMNFSLAPRTDRRSFGLVGSYSMK